MGYSQVIQAFGLTLVAGMATGIGSLLALVLRKTSSRFLSFALGFSAGFMIYVSFVEILEYSREGLIHAWGQNTGSWAAVGSFFAGVVLIAVIDRLVPSVENPHEARRVEQMASCSTDASGKAAKLMRVGFMSAMAIAVHNFPEGIATFTAALQKPTLGYTIAFAIAIHNIPEGIAVAVPIYCATGSRRKAFRLSILSGLSEPLGALIGFLVLMPFLNETVMSVLLGIVAGIMVFISLDELLPTAREYGAPHLAVYGLFSGMAVMAVSLQLF